VLLSLIYCNKCGKELADNTNYCSGCGTSVTGENVKEKFEVAGEDLVEKVKSLLHEANVRRIIIKNQEGKTVFEVPCSIGVISAVLVPILAALGAIAALAMSYTIIVERKP
jgi:uncharacterized membrane protein YvbJ|tara:strand:- start:195 stop:527 length:333 start_codon:yes stop_codon:yes gene_type:complete